MDAPLGVTFFKKVELYQKISSLDGQTSKMVAKGGHKPLWPLEKKVLKWAYMGHKFLGSPITTDDFSVGNKDNKLKDFKIKPNEIGDIRLTSLLDNFIAHGFATEILEGRLYTGHSPILNRKIKKFYMTNHLKIKNSSNIATGYCQLLMNGQVLITS